MNLFVKGLEEKKAELKNPILWTVFILFIIISWITIANHEMWGDEVHSWNIAKGSHSFSDLINNTRYEGHPPVWYIILWSISKFTHDLNYVKGVHFIVAILTVFLLVFFSSFPISTKSLIPFGYFFLFEYTAISRNYGIGVLIAFAICLIIRKDFRYKNLMYYLLLFLLCNVHLLGIILAASLHLYFLLFLNEKKVKRNAILLHALLGIMIALPAVYFIFPPADSELGTQFWMNRMTSNKLSAFIQAPLRAFLPLSAWWNYNSWNTQFLVEAKNSYPIFRFINLIVVTAILILMFFLLRKNRKSLFLFFSNLILSFIVSIASITLTSERHSGFLFIGFIVSVWLYCYVTPISVKIKWWINGLLIVQLIAGIFSVIKDIRYPFSNFKKTADLVKEVPMNEKLVTDYWGLNSISAFLDKPTYCIDIQKEISFIKWDNDLKKATERKYRYTEGVTNYFQNKNINSIYMFSTSAPAVLSRIDSQLSRSFKIELVDRREGAIEKSGNLYLYKISKE